MIEGILGRSFTSFTEGLQVPTPTSDPWGCACRGAIASRCHRAARRLTVAATASHAGTPWPVASDFITSQVPLCRPCLSMGR